MMAILQCPHNANACPKGQYNATNLPGCADCPTAIDGCEREDAKDKEECKNSCRKGELQKLQAKRNRTRDTAPRSGNHYIVLWL